MTAKVVSEKAQPETETGHSKENEREATPYKSVDISCKPPFHPKGKDLVCY
jgi:hypothetical protein